MREVTCVRMVESASVEPCRRTSARISKTEKVAPRPIRSKGGASDSSRLPLLVAHKNRHRCSVVVAAIEMSIDGLDHRQRGVPQDPLEVEDVHPSAQCVGRIGVPEEVRVYAPLDAGGDR